MISQYINQTNFGQTNFFKIYLNKQFRPLNTIGIKVTFINVTIQNKKKVLQIAHFSIVIKLSNKMVFRISGIQEFGCNDQSSDGVGGYGVVEIKVHGCLVGMILFYSISKRELILCMIVLY